MPSHPKERHSNLRCCRNRRSTFSGVWPHRNRCLTCLGLQAFKHIGFSRVGDPMAIKKTTTSYAYPLACAPCHPKEGPSNLTSKLDQQPHKRQNKQDRPPPLVHPQRRSGHHPIGSIDYRYSRSYDGSCFMLRCQEKAPGPCPTPPPTTKNRLINCLIILKGDHAIKQILGRHTRTKTKLIFSHVLNDNRNEIT